MVIIFLLILCLISIYYYCNNFSILEKFQSANEIKIISINELKFGFLNQDDKDFLNMHQIKAFPLPLPLQNIKNPTTNLSKETLKEIDFLVEISDKITEKQKQSIEKYEKDTFNEFIKYCKINKLYYDFEYLQGIRDDIKALVYQLKEIYNRPRPYQLGFYLEKKIYCRQSNSFTPSYPSYRTLLSKTLANIISYNNPKFANNLHTLAKEVELSRLLGGYNYPSDNAVSLDISNILKDHIKYSENIKNK